VHAEIDGDTFFPQINEEEWQLQSAQLFEADEKNKFAHTIEIWEKKL